MNNCLFCNKETANKKFCSISCSSKNFQKCNKKEKILNNCLFCNNETANKKFCSMSCCKKYQWKYENENLLKSVLKLKEINTGNKHTEESKNKMKESLAKFYSDGKIRHKVFKNGKKYTHERSLEIGKKISKTIAINGGVWIKGKTKHTDKRVRKMGRSVSKELKKQYASGKLSNSGKNNPMFGKTHTPEAIKKIFSHRKMNGLEKFVADILIENNIQFYYQFFLSRDNKVKSYDFKIKDKNVLIEIDGDFWHGKDPNNNHKIAIDSRENDLVKNKLAIDNNFILLRFWESDLKNKPEILMNKLNEILI